MSPDAGEEIEATQLDTLDGVAIRPARRSPVLFVLLGGCLPLTLALLAGGVVVGLDVGGLRTYLIDRFEFENDGLQPSYGSEASASPVAEDTLADVEDGSGLRFVSAWTDTHKITARCSGGIGRGATQALVAIDSAERCAITAIRTDRTRKVAVVDAVEVGTYDCFVAGVSECSRR